MAVLWTKRGTLKAIKLSQDIRPISDLKTRASEIVEQARRNHRPILLTRHGRGVAVLLDLEEYESLTERAAFVSAVEEGARAAREGDLHPHEEAAVILRSFGE
jgi:prevent-host-death family protein